MSKAWDDQYNSGYEKGFRKGFCKSFCDSFCDSFHESLYKSFCLCFKFGIQITAMALYKDGSIDIAKAAEKCNMSEEEFLKLVEDSKMK